MTDRYDPLLDRALEDAEVAAWYAAFEKVSGSEATTPEGKRHIYDEFLTAFFDAKPARAIEQPQPHRSVEELGHRPDGITLFHLDTCIRCGLMLAYLVRDQVECGSDTEPSPE